MPYIKLLKLLYLADRQMLIQHAKPITYDRWASMRYGPVLCATYDLIKTSRSSSVNYWNRHLQTDNYDVVMLSDPGTGALSKAEDRVIADIYEKFGAEDWTKLVEMIHELGQWSDPGASSNPITYREVLEVQRFAGETINDIIDNINAQDFITSLASK